MFFPKPPETTTPMIATRDIAGRAADLLQDLSWSGSQAVPLLGPRDLSYADAAAVLSDALGRPIAAQQVPPEALAQQLKGFGATNDWADGMVALYTSIGTPGYNGAKRSPESTTPTELSDYVAGTLKPMLAAMSA